MREKYYNEKMLQKVTIPLNKNKKKILKIICQYKTKNVIKINCVELTNMKNYWILCFKMTTDIKSGIKICYVEF